MERYGYSQENFSTWILRFDVIEFGETTQIFERPKDKRTEDYITGRFG